MQHLCSPHKWPMEIGHHKWPLKAIVVPNAKHEGLQLKLLEVTSGDQVQLVTSEDYTNTIIFTFNHV